MRENTINMSWKVFDELVEKLVAKIPKDKFKYILAIPRGGLPLATCLSYRLGIKNVILEYEDHMKRDEVLVVDDISDTGLTLDDYDERCFAIACLCYKEGTHVVPDYFATKYYNDGLWVSFPWNPTKKGQMRE